MTTAVSPPTAPAGLVFLVLYFILAYTRGSGAATALNIFRH